MPHLFCFGYGYTARRLALALASEGWTFAATCRSVAAADLVTRDGGRAVMFTNDRPIENLPAALERDSHIVSSIPPGEQGDLVVRHHGADLAACASRISWAGYLSTTGIYGDRGGAWVDEKTSPRPATGRARRRLEAERAWAAFCVHGIAVHIFRLAGIYGPGRNQLEAVNAGKARRIVKPGQVFGRIHVDDIVTVLRASMARPNPGGIYNVCDDEPAPPHDVVAFAAQLLGVEPPRETTVDKAGLSAVAASFYAENKRVSNQRIKRELGVELNYPTYREGLRALLEGVGR